jgi:hypothetical protein
MTEAVDSSNYMCMQTQRTAVTCLQRLAIYCSVMNVFLFGLRFLNSISLQKIPSYSNDRKACQFYRPIIFFCNVLVYTVIPSTI